MPSKCLTVAVESWVPHITIEGEGDNLVVSGIMPEVIDIIMKKLGSCYKFIRSKDRLFGERMPNGSWSGLVGVVARGEADMSGLGVMITPNRLEVVDISEYLYLDEMSAGYKKPVVESDIKGFLKPFALQSWVLILLTMLGVLTAACAVRIAYARLSHNRGWNKSSAQTNKEASTYEAVLWTVGAILAQTVPMIPRGNSVRVISGLWLLVSLILCTVYRSNLKAMLILPKVNLPFDNLEQLAETGLPIWVSSGSIVNQAIQSAPPGTSLGNLVPHVYNTDPVMAIQRLVTGDHVLLVPRSALLQIIHETFSKTGLCKNYIMSESFMKTTTLRLLFPKGSMLREKIDPIIWRLRESGILNHIYLKRVSNATECLKHDSASPNNNLRTLELGDFFGIFIVYAVGILIASLTFSIEVALGCTRSGEGDSYPSPKSPSDSALGVEE